MFNHPGRRGLKVVVMMSCPTRLTAVLMLASFPGVALGADDGESLSVAEQQFFENRIRPVLIENCYECHSRQAETVGGNLLLDSKPSWMKGGDSGPVIVPGELSSSRLITAIRFDNVDLQMPPDGKLARHEIQDLEKWVAMGAPDPRLDDGENSFRNSQDLAKEFNLEERVRSHWSWQPRQTVALPEVKTDTWPNRDLDRFILARLEGVGLQPAPSADRQIWLRRVTFDLTGLPPTPEEIEDFLSRESPDAYQGVVDRLLDSKHFGEHWGQHWLDLVRFAETRGHEGDFEIPEAYRYRDYVIEAINQDVPYDRLIEEHVAGDLLERPRLHHQDRSNQSIQGTGFWHLGLSQTGPIDIRGEEADRVQNQIDVFSRMFLGLSMGCARCHDHKFDAISTKDYYAIFGYLQSSGYHLADVSDPEKQQEVASQLDALWESSQLSMRKTLVELYKYQLSQLKKYLIVAGRQDLPSERTPTEIDQDVLNELRCHLETACQDVQNPIHLVARVLTSDTELTAERLREVQSEVRETLEKTAEELLKNQESLQVIVSQKEGEGNYHPVSRNWTEADQVEDFCFTTEQQRTNTTKLLGEPTQVSPRRWITAGHRFGNGPVRVGELLVRFDEQQLPQLYVADANCAVSYRRSTQLSGMIRTRTFEVTGDKLWYRYRGKAEVFLAIDSFRAFTGGPLHMMVKQEIKGNADQWKWHAVELRDYLGHRIHVEFTPGEGFVLDQVVFAAVQPPDEPRRSRWQLQQVTTEIGVETPFVDMVSSVIDSLLAVVVRFSTGEMDAGDAAVMNWLFQNEDVFQSATELKQRLENELSAFRQVQMDWEQKLPVPIRALTLLDGSAEDEPVHIRGNHQNLGEHRVARRFLTALGGEDQPYASLGSGRMELARHLTDPDNPLVSRVMVNRIWYHLMGRGLVETTDDFGAMGKMPTHPQLLDYLAERFIQSGWSVKQMIHDIVLSSTYRMSSRSDSRQKSLDSNNQLWHRTFVRRLSAETIRDTVLTVSGRLDRKLFGPSVKVHLTPFMRGNRGPQEGGPLDGDGRRSIYTEVRRNHLPPMLLAFDRPIPSTTISKRNVSNAPAQSLIMLNDPLIHQQAAIWSKRLERFGDPASRITTAYLQAYGRQPTEAELVVTIRFLQSQQQRYEDLKSDQPAVKAWVDLCHTLMNVKEFIYY